MASTKELFNDLAAADAAGDTELAQVIASRIKEVEAQQAPAPAASPSSSALSNLLAMSAGGFAENPMPQVTPETALPVYAGAVRYGGPLLAATLATPTSLGTGTLPAYLAASAVIQGLTSFGSEAAASAIEGSPMTKEKLEAAGIAGLASGAFVPAGPIVSKVPVLSNIYGRIATNVASSVAGAYGIRKVQGETLSGMSLKDWGLVTGIPALGTVAGQYGQRAVNREAARKAIAAERGSEQSVSLTDIDPAFAKSEARAYKDGVRKAIMVVDNMDVPVARKIAALEADPEIGVKFSQEFRPKVEDITRLQKLQDDANVAAEQATRAKNAYEANLRSQNPLLIQKLKDEADVAAMKALAGKALYSQETQKTLFAAGVPLPEDVGVGAMQEAMTTVRNGLDKTRKRLLDDAYAQIGIDENAQVGSLKTIVKTIKKSFTEETDRSEALRLIRSAYRDVYSGTNFKKGEITRGGISKIKERIAENLVAEGMRPTNANRKASQLYATLLDNTNEYISSNYGKPVAETITSVNKKAADLYKSLDSDIFDYFSTSGSQNPEAFVSQMILEGKGNRLKELSSFIQSVAAFGDEYVPLAVDLEKKVHSVVRQGLIKKSYDVGQGGDAAFKKLNIGELSKSLNAMKEYGYPVEMLNLGGSGDIKRLANIATAAGVTRMNAKDLDFFASIAPSLGADSAFAHILYRNEFKRQLIENGFVDIARKNASLYRMAAKLGKDEKQIAESVKMLADSVNNDPIVKLLKDPVNSISRLNLQSPSSEVFMNDVMSLPPSTITKLRDTLIASGKSELLSDISKTAIASKFKSLFTISEGGNIGGIDSKKFGAFFMPQTQEAQNDLVRFKNLLGEEQFKTLENGLIKTLKGIGVTRERLGGSGNYKDLGILIKGAALPSNVLGQGSATGNQLLLGSVNSFLTALNSSNYQTAHLLYANPSIAPLWAKMGYNLNNLSRLAPAEANKFSIALKLAEQRDAKEKQESGKPQ